MNASFCPSDPDLPPRFAHVPAGADAPEADTAARVAMVAGVDHAYVHWHDPDTVTIHPFEDTPLGDAA